MGRVLQFLTTRVMRSRAGLAVLIAALVLGIVGVARVVSGTAGSRSAHAPAPPLVADTPAVPDDGLVAPQVTVSPTVIPGAAAPETVARAFAVAWIAHTDISAAQWHAQLVPHATARLAEQLSGVDPVTVPADRITGEPTVIPQAETVVAVVIPVDSGELRLRLLVADDRWLVDSVDWERA